MRGSDFLTLFLNGMCPKSIRTKRLFSEKCGLFSEKSRFQIAIFREIVRARHFCHSGVTFSYRNLTMAIFREIFPISEDSWYTGRERNEWRVDIKFDIKAHVHRYVYKHRNREVSLEEIRDWATEAYSSWGSCPLSFSIGEGFLQITSSIYGVTMWVAQKGGCPGRGWGFWIHRLGSGPAPEGAWVDPSVPPPPPTWTPSEIAFKAPLVTPDLKRMVLASVGDICWTNHPDSPWGFDTKNLNRLRDRLDKLGHPDPCILQEAPSKTKWLCIHGVNVVLVKSQKAGAKKTKPFDPELRDWLMNLGEVYVVSNRELPELEDAQSWPKGVKLWPGDPSVDHKNPLYPIPLAGLKARPKPIQAPVEEDPLDEEDDIRL